MNKCREIARNVELFHGLTVEDVAKILKHGMTIHVQKGETIFYRDTTGSQMYVVLGGKVGIHDGKDFIAYLTTGDMFGEMALIDSGSRSATVIAVEDSYLFVLSETTFHRLMTKRVSVQILLNMMRTLSHRLREANTKLKKVVHHQV
ncbi:MAG: cyclic nucleotide-binding domain-containing protein [Nitrospiraceae bacterium]|nr:cyclic nucleotide-binding domain-containing protein [Nitrospiraceae bacterium]